MDAALIDVAKAAFLGVVEGLTEFLPVSSTGHLLIANQFVHFDKKAFVDMFDIVIQLGAILSVVVIFWKRINPFSSRLTPVERSGVWSLWGKTLVAFIPHRHRRVSAGQLGRKKLLQRFHRRGDPDLLRRGVHRGRAAPQEDPVETVDSFPYWLAFALGVIQILSLVPGTSRSGITIIGALLLGVSRFGRREFTFFLAIPTMVARHRIFAVQVPQGERLGLTGTESVALATGFVVSFLSLGWLLWPSSSLSRRRRLFRSESTGLWRGWRCWGTLPSRAR